MRKLVITFPAVILLWLTGARTSSGAELRNVAGVDSLKRPLPVSTSITPEYCQAFHNIGKLVLGVNNWGTFGSAVDDPDTSCVLGGRSRVDLKGQGTFPKGSWIDYLYMGGL